MKLLMELLHDVVHWRGRTRVPLIMVLEEDSHPSPPLPTPPVAVLNLSPDESFVSVLLIEA